MTMPQGLPDLGNIGRPAQLQVVATALVGDAAGLPPELVDAARLVELMRVMVREEFERLTPRYQVTEDGTLALLPPLAVVDGE